MAGGGEADFAGGATEATVKTYNLTCFPPRGFAGAFRDNVRRLLEECCWEKETAVEGSPAWRILLSDERTGLVPLFIMEKVGFIEGEVGSSQNSFCNECRCSGWSHHFVSRRRYHFIIPAEHNWEKLLQSVHLPTHLLHGVVHSNGFGHLLCINRSRFLCGNVLMSLWDRLCDTLRVREITVVGAACEEIMNLRFVYDLAYGKSWLGIWEYRVYEGRFGVTDKAYKDALVGLSSSSLDAILAELSITGCDEDLRSIISRPNDGPPLLTISNLLLFLLGRTSARRKMEHQEPYREFDVVASEKRSWWEPAAVRRAAEAVVKVLQESRVIMTRVEVRDKARLIIGDGGLLDSVLSFIGGCLVGNQVVRRRKNPTTRIFEFTVEDLAPAQLEEDISQAEKDIESVFKSLVTARPVETRMVLDAKFWVKQWALRDDADDKFRFFVMWKPNVVEMKDFKRGLPPGEVVVIDVLNKIKYLKEEVERALRDTYYFFEGFQVSALEGVEGLESDLVALCGKESGSELAVHGEWPDGKRYTLLYEGGDDVLEMACECGACDNDGELTVECEGCHSLHHKRCAGIADTKLLTCCAICGKDGPLGALTSGNTDPKSA